MSPRPAVTTTLACAATIAVAALPLRIVFGGWGWALSVVGAAFLASIVASALETLRRNSTILTITAVTTVGAAVWAFLFPLASSMWRSTQSRQTWSSLGEAVFDGWGALLDDRAPLTDPGSAETFAALVVWVAAAIAVHLAAQRRTAIGVIVGAAVVLSMCTSAALPRNLAPALVGGVAGGVALVAIATMTRASDQRFHVSRVAALLGFVVASGAVATGAGALFASLDREPVDPRSRRTTEVVSVVVPDLLAEFEVRRLTNEDVLTVESSVAAEPLRLRLQTYGTHDGEKWLPAANFAEVATFPGPTALPPGEVVTLSLNINDLDGPWLPLPDRLITLGAQDLRLDEATQTALRPPDLDSYDLTGTIVTVNDLALTETSADAAPDAFTELPAGLPESLRKTALDAAAGADDSVAAINALTARVRELERDVSSPPGSSMGRLANDLDAASTTGAEQIASLHALMLRVIGLPSRVVVGYVSTESTIRPADLQVWTEVAFPEVGWVPSYIDPTATEADTPPALNEPQSSPAPEDRSVQARAVPRELGPGEDPDEPDLQTDRPLTKKVVIAAVVLAILTLAAVLLLRKAVRRVRRRVGGRNIDTRVLGAWAELIDRLREKGLAVDATTTINDVAERSTDFDAQLGHHAEALGGLAMKSLHGPNGATASDHGDAWEILGHAEARLHELRGRRFLASRFLDPRVLRFSAPMPPSSREGGWRSRLMQSSLSS